MTPHMNDVREQLMETLKSLTNREQPMEVDRARAVAQVASVLVDTAKVEVDYLRITGQDRSGFLEEPAHPHVAHLGVTPTGTVAHLPGGITRHRLAG